MEASVNALNKPQWFVARTRYFRHELKIRDWLIVHNFENFVPTTRIHTVNAGRGTGKRKMIEKPLAPNLVFLKAPKEEACALVTDNHLPMEFIVDCATHRMMVVPEKQMEDFRRVLDSSIEEGGLVDQPLLLGDRVQVIKGPLKEVEGYVVEFRGKFYITVSLVGFVWARAQVPRAWMVKV